MAFGADDIRNKDFHVSFFLGYKIPEVDDFLDIMFIEFDRLEKRNAELEEKLRMIEQAEEPEEAGAPEASRLQELEDRIRYLEKRVI